LATVRVERAVSSGGLPFQDVASELGAPVVGCIGELKGSQRGFVASRGGELARAYEALWAAVAGDAAAGRPILVSSGAPRQGKSIVAANLAVAAMRSGHSLLVVDAVGGSRLRRAFGSGSLSAGESMGDGLARFFLIEGHGRETVGSTTVVGPTARSAGLDWLESALGRFAGESERVLVHAPELLSAEVATRLAALDPLVLLVAGHEHMTAAEVSRLRQVLTTSGLVPAGIAVTGTGRRVARQWLRRAGPPSVRPAVSREAEVVSLREPEPRQVTPTAVEALPADPGPPRKETGAADLEERAVLLQRQEDEVEAREESVLRAELELRSRERSLADQVAAAQARAETLDRREEQLTQDVAAQTAELAERAARLQRQKQEVAAREESVLRAELEMQSREEALTDRVTRVHARAEALDQREEQLTQEVAARTAELEEHAASLQREKDELAAHEESVRRSEVELGSRKGTLADEVEEFHAHAREVATRTAELDAWAANLRRQEDELAALRESKAQLDRELEALEIRERSVAERERTTRDTAARAAAALTERNGALNDREVELATREEAASQREGELDLREESLAEQEAAGVASGGALTARAEALAEREAELAAREPALAKAEAAAADVEERAAAAQESTAQRARELDLREASLAEREATAVARAEELDDREIELAARERVLKEAEAAAADLDERAAVAQRQEAELAAREESSAHRERELEVREGALADSMGEIHARAEMLDRREDKLVERERALAEAEAAAADLEEPAAIIQGREPELAAPEVPEPEPPEPASAEPEAVEPEPEPEALAPVEPQAADTGTLAGLRALVAAAAPRFPERADEWNAYLDVLAGYADPDGRIPERLTGVIEQVYGALFLPEPVKRRGRRSSS
jgi:Mrp family chromosome partitioning ATPase